MEHCSISRDALREHAIRLHLEGNGYKTIATHLGISRDTARNWIVSYKQTGRIQSVHTTGRFPGAHFLQKETKFADARKEYETSCASLRSIAEKHGHIYNNFRYFLMQYHPESALLHAYVKQKMAVKEEIARQREALQKMEEDVLTRLQEELKAHLRKLGK